MTKKVHLTVLARKALSDLWMTAWLRGRTWGRKFNGDNCFRGTNITMAIGKDELVSVSEEKGELVIHSFVRVGLNSLGKEVKEVLEAAGLPIKQIF